MENRSMTALVSAFSRAYHTRNNEVKIFDDSIAKQLLTDEEYDRISKTMADGIGFFHPAFVGDAEQALRWIVDNQLSPSPLGRAAFAEKSLAQAVQVGAKQYLILGAGYDTFAYRQPLWAAALEIFELDHPATARDKQQRIKNGQLFMPSNLHFAEADFTNETWEKTLLTNKVFDDHKISCCSVLGVAYYLPKDAFERLVSTISGLVPKGSTMIFDYPDENCYTEHAGERAKKQAMLASTANEKMLASYSYSDMERLLSAHDFLIYEHLTPQEITEQYFAKYNQANPAHHMTAFDNVNYCLAVKQ